MSEYIVRETGYPGAIKQEIVSELVRCRDCICYTADEKWCDWHLGEYEENDYCSHGEKR